MARSDPEVMAMTATLHGLLAQARTLTEEIDHIVDDLEHQRAETSPAEGILVPPFRTQNARGHERRDD